MEQRSSQFSAAARPEGGLAAYAAAIRAHKWVVAAITLAAIAASLLFLLTRSAQYEASADLLVNPLPQEDETYVGLPLIRDTGDPVRTVQTAASLIESRAAANQTANELGADWTGDEVLDAIEVAPRGESNVLAVTARAGDPDEAATVANEFVTAVLQVREDEIKPRAGARIAEIDARLAATPAADQITRAELISQRDQLRSLIERGDPTLSRSQDAVPDDDALGTPPPLVVAIALLAGFVLGSGTAMLMELFARRVRDEEDALQIYRLPVLARVPDLPSSKRRGAAGSVWFLPPAIREPMRTLTVQLRARHGPRGAVMVTSPTAGDGKTTSAINLAVTLSASGASVVLLDFDLRKAQVSVALGLERGVSLSELVDPANRLEGLLEPVPGLPSMRVLPMTTPDELGPLDLGPVEAVGQRLPELLAQGRTLADHVVVDTAPLGEVGDALQVAREVDDIVVVVRPGNTLRSHLDRVRDLLERSGKTPGGYLVLGRVEAGRDYYGYGARAIRVPGGVSPGASDGRRSESGVGAAARTGEGARRSSSRTG